MTTMSRSSTRDGPFVPRIHRSRIISRVNWTPPNLYSGSKRGKRVKAFDFLILWSAIFAGLLGSGAVLGIGLFQHYKRQHKYCLVLDEQFDGPLNTNLWKHEVQIGGFGNGEFEWTTSSPKNSFTQDGYLWITPTLTSDEIGEHNIIDGYTVNLTESKTCTAQTIAWEDQSKNLNAPLAMQAIGNADTPCQARSNLTLGTIIPPVQSARLTTRETFSLRYGRLEVRAKMPTGDWLWPAIWMMPRDSVYGEWPQSGEIDILESKGNIAKERSQLFSNTMTSSLHFGRDSTSDQYLKTRDISVLWRNLFNQGYHTFGLEWDEKGIWTWRDSRARRVLSVSTDVSFYERMPLIAQPGAAPINGPNPWSTSTSRAAPFDQDFYLILNLAVGGTNGYFSDFGQPWSNNDPKAAATFWSKRQSWLPSWGDWRQRSMSVDYVKAWRHC